MNREIKFRAFNINDKKMYTKLYLDFQGKIGMWNMNETEIDFDTNYDFLKLMQFTGLEDKNGVEIYFEDFYSVHNIDYLVKWNKSKISLIDIANGVIIDYIEGGKIKSNIYENEHKITGKYIEIP